MIKRQVLSLITLAVLGSTAFAGHMGPMATSSTSTNHAFFTTLEGGYSWTSMNNTTVNGNRIGDSNTNWGGRFGVGATHWVCDSFGYTAEMGWGYYAKTTYNSAANGIDAKNQVYGFDLLVGSDLVYGQYDLAFKFGAMIQNIRMNHNTNLDNLVTGANVTGYANTTLTSSYAVPEIKFVAAYNFNDQWALTGAFMYVIGNGNVSTKLTRSFDGTTITSQSSTTGGPVALGTLSLGLRYSFA